MELTVGFFMSFFQNLTVWGIILAILFGTIWIISFWPSMIKQPWHWAVLFGSALFTAFAIAFVQRPFQNLIGTAMVKYMGI